MAAAGLVAALILVRDLVSSASPAVVIHQARWVAPGTHGDQGDQPSLQNPPAVAPGTPKGVCPNPTCGSVAIRFAV